MRGRGRQRELAVVHRFQTDGWIAYRLAEGAADVAAFKRGEVPWLIQVKGNAGRPWMNFRPPDRAALIDEAHRAGARAVLIHWPPRGDPRVYRSTEWPPFNPRTEAIA